MWFFSEMWRVTGGEGLEVGPSMAMTGNQESSLGQFCLQSRYTQWLTSWSPTPSTHNSGHLGNICGTVDDRAACTQVKIAHRFITS